MSRDNELMARGICPACYSEDVNFGLAEEDIPECRTCGFQFY